VKTIVLFLSEGHHWGHLLDSPVLTGSLITLEIIYIMLIWLVVDDNW